MSDFRDFLESNDSDARDSIRKLPASHRKLVRGFNIKFVGAGTIPGDDEHIGKVANKPNKNITIAAPWFYPRQFALLHEIAHLIWAKYIKGTDLEKKWLTIYKNTKGRVRQNAEECMCHAYANYYSHNKIEKHNHPAWDEFIRKLPKG